jgi:hypothetical protein
MSLPKGASDSIQKIGGIKITYKGPRGINIVVGQMSPER